jgi:DNA-binding MarR family transcriptional regulator
VSEYNEVLFALIQNIENYLNKERSAAKGSRRDYSAASKLKTQLCHLFPKLSASFLEAPDIVFVIRMIDFAVSGLTDRVSDTIWKKYYQGGGTLFDLEDELNYARSTVQRLLKSFPEKISIQLWRKEQEISSPPIIPPITLVNDVLRMFESEFDLSMKQAQVLLVFCVWQSLGLKEVCRRLSISENTLKIHKKRIIKRMQVETMNHAATKARPHLQNHLGELWCERLLQTLDHDNTGYLL